MIKLRISNKNQNLDIFIWFQYLKVFLISVVLIKRCRFFGGSLLLTEPKVFYKVMQHCIIELQQIHAWALKMAQHLEGACHLAWWPELCPGSHIVEGENWLCKLSSDLYMHAMCMRARAHTHTHTFKVFNKIPRFVENKRSRCCPFWLQAVGLVMVLAWCCYGHLWQEWVKP